ncbi:MULTISPECIES: bifunctional 4-hydroxy-2-oxoglutarate aldolase/2-dehydro-3-deoxy-phosphogluconate aldolase [Prauserella salsuginis group]|uniref:2-dehydro-3-deoxyphosphogluconate aldolase/(4S)-4-hydroxy-2-oxoglutarate aldolase n=2 Tax=Prauserella salsuginis group TaxID=2893672 RepID=A0A839XNS8_9PSEU|nr:MULTISPECIES: bifunctional 4-hydroxy-2-oxoglutarate aldolase/2-dehydro-3-deoxy-phosphogluconate aldolase [Prauserella salsuginis group]MBB3662498.1 2-dehydro-3-deoxyphosphogluconate aldolase/(4S)-4-hydroxy-2-oxoglutarate aldolase [Prauserella sediminis]MCR3720207.1 2-dehydro-3-deoxyphosphogluconate aldolase / (4S)-4-hydroxy-2-oxoglutarate aldolase [Prauserella flava]MCR3734084.1 2-dehydro-3-deoxyphosphogluconate aldolase / (4S)-4-hydroxy-2-oxoglutarate aldolase [Prauserella salsuginis]
MSSTKPPQSGASESSAAGTTPESGALLGDALRSTRIVAILRGRSGEHVDAVVDTLVDAGVRCLEITMNTPGALDAVRGAAERHGTSAKVGVGTVRTPEHVNRAAEAGAEFVVAPDTDSDVAARVHTHGLGYFPGALTATEVTTAAKLGATAVKIFPASLTGPGYIRELRAPLDDIELLPTGGVTLDLVRPYLDAGACGLGIGSPLLGDALDGGDLGELRRRAHAFLAETGAAA